MGNKQILLNKPSKIVINEDAEFPQPELKSTVGVHSRRNLDSVKKCIELVLMKQTWSVYFPAGAKQMQPVKISSPKLAVHWKVPRAKFFFPNHE